MNELPARKLRISHVSEATGAPQSTLKKQIENGTLKLRAPQTDAWKTFSDEDAQRAAAIAEVTRIGLDPAGQARVIWYHIADGFYDLANNRADLSRGYFVIAEIFGPEESFGDLAELAESTDDLPINAWPCGTADLTKHLTDRDTLTQATSWVVIDVIAAWQRFHQRLERAIGRGEK